MSLKRKRQDMNVYTKVEMLKMLDAGVSRKYLANKYEIDVSTISKMVKNRDKIFDRLGSADISSCCKRMRPSIYKDVDDGLLEWYNRQKSAQAEISGPMLMEAAEMVAREIGIIDWSCSNGFLERFKKRHGIKFKAASPDTSPTKHYVKEELLSDLDIKEVMSNSVSQSQSNYLKEVMSTSASQSNLSVPAGSTDGELNLLRILERANLTQYYEAFLSQGGDDIDQLLEAGEEEFLEIMALVGMASKPLHVRRLQKSLHDWVTNPELFKQAPSQHPLSPISSAAALGSILASVHRSTPAFNTPNGVRQMPIAYPVSFNGLPSFAGMQSIAGLPHIQRDETSSLSIGRGGERDQPSRREELLPPRIMDSITPFNLEAMPPRGTDTITPRGMESITPRGMESISFPSMKSISPYSEGSELDCTNYNQSGESHLYPPGSRLMESQIKAIERTAKEIAQSLPMYAPKPLNMKKMVDREIEETMNLAHDDPKRLDLFRKFGAIYGRFDSKRNKDKQMNFHEMCVNEAAAQLCLHRPALVTRREDLFFQARQVVKEAGFQLTRTQYRSKEYPTANPQDDFQHPSKLVKIEPTYMHIPNSWGIATDYMGGQAEESQLSLVDEGLRIARQYGLGEDFEEEIRSLQKSDSSRYNNGDPIDLTDQTNH